MLGLFAALTLFCWLVSLWLVVALFLRCMVGYVTSFYYLVYFIVGVLFMRLRASIGFWGLDLLL